MSFVAYMFSGPLLKPKKPYKDNFIQFRIDNHKASRQRVLDVMTDKPMTAKQIATALGKPTASYTCELLNYMRQEGLVEMVGLVKVPGQRMMKQSWRKKK